MILGFLRKKNTKPERSPISNFRFLRIAIAMGLGRWSCERIEMERENWRELNNGNSNGYYDRFVCDYDEEILREVPSRERSPSSPLRLGYIEHYVSKFDTLAGVAIKYGVEVPFFLLLFTNYFFIYL